jgi:hypothetical protein
MLNIFIDGQDLIQLLIRRGHHDQLNVLMRFSKSWANAM